MLSLAKSYDAKRMMGFYCYHRIEYMWNAVVVATKWRSNEKDKRQERARTRRIYMIILLFGVYRRIIKISSQTKAHSPSSHKKKKKKKERNANNKLKSRCFLRRKQHFFPGTFSSFAICPQCSQFWGYKYKATASNL